MIDTVVSVSRYDTITTELWLRPADSLTGTWVLLRQPRHSYVCVRVLAMAIRPHRLQTWTWYGSEASNRRSLRNWAAPWAIWQSRSISPKRSPPSLRVTQASPYRSERSIRTINQTAQQCNWPWSALHRLPVEDLDRAPGPWMNLIVHHVF